MGLGKTYSTKYLLDSNNSSGADGQVLISTSTGIDWSDANTIGNGLYLPLAGGTMTGGVTMGDSNGYYSHELKFSNDTHQAGIDFQNSGELRFIDRSGSRESITFNLLNGSIEAKSTGNTVTNFISTSGNSYFNGGNVGIGTTNPNRPLTIRTNNSSYGSMRIYRDSNTLGEASIGFFGTATQAPSESWVIGEGGWSNSGDFVIGNENGGAGGNVRLLVQRNGNVGIGTTSPGSKLDVNGIISLGGAKFAEYVSTSDLFTIGDIDGAGAELALHTDSGEAVRIDLLGNVGIGTTNPGAKLEVAGQINGTSISVNGIDQNSASRYSGPDRQESFTRTVASNSATQWFKLIDGGGGPTTIRLSIGSAGDNTNMNDEYLISTAGYGFYMHIQRLPGVRYNGSKLLSVLAVNPSNGGSTEVWIQLQGMSSTSGTTYVSANVPLQTSAQMLASATTTKPAVTSNDAELAVTDADRNTYTVMTSRGGKFDGRVDAGGSISSGGSLAVLGTGDSYFTGNVGIGATNPGQKLTVNGRALIQNSTTPFYIKVNSTYKSWVHHIGSNDSYIFAPSTADGGETWDWSNQTAFSSSGVVTANNFVLSSDKRNKTKIEDLAGDNVDISWKSFEMKGNEGEYRTGVIAQELEENHPEFVNTDDKGFKSVKYIDLLIAKIAELEARLEKAGI